VNASRWASLNELTMLLELCGSRETPHVMLDVSNTLRRLANMGLRASARIETSNKREFEPYC
jgi:hypothetical protein